MANLFLDVVLQYTNFVFNCMIIATRCERHQIVKRDKKNILQPFSQDYDLASHTTYVVCNNFLHKWRVLQFKVVSERFLRNFSWHFFLRNFCQKSTERKKPPKKYFWFVVWPGVWTCCLSSKKLSIWRRQIW